SNQRAVRGSDACRGWGIGLARRRHYRPPQSFRRVGENDGNGRSLRLFSFLTTSPNRTYNRRASTYILHPLPSSIFLYLPQQPAIRIPAPPVHAGAILWI